ncbi:MAG: porin [Acidobacteriia bacterium]|nr:porin [Terriglobia bacterium]
MRGLRYTQWVVTGFCLWILVSSGLRAQNSDSSAGTNEQLRQRLEDLQKQMNQLQDELARVQRELKESKSAPSPASAPAPVAAPETAPASSLAPSAEAAASKSSPNALQSVLGSTSLSGFMDGYYGYNFNQPHDRLSSYRAFDGPSNQFGLNMIELILDKTPDAANSRLGFRLALGYGQAMNVVNSSDPGGLGFAQYLKEAYFSYLAPVGKNGLQLDFGKFVTPHGAEVIETKDNWNYSRGLLFTYAIPFYHFGLRTKYTFNSKYALSGFLVNGWNNIVDNNTGKTYGVTFNWNPHKKFGLAQGYMAGPEQTGINQNWRQLSDTVVTISPTDKLTFLLNYDYGRGDRIGGLLNPVSWQGWAGYARYAFDERNAIALRYEWFDDPNGFTTGAGQQLKEFTGTVERRVAHHLLTRLEYRYDYSNQATFVKGDRPAGGQNTVAAGLIYTFDTRESP